MTLRFDGALRLGRAALPLLLAACSPAPDSATDNATAPVARAEPAPAAAPALANVTVGGDGSAIMLERLSGADIMAAGLAGELACSFGAADESMLLIARGDVASSQRAFGVVKLAGYVESVSAPGGYDGMLRGAAFVGKGKTVRIDLTEAAPRGKGESPPRPATLTYERGDGASRTFPGSWTCGP